MIDSLSVKAHACASGNEIHALGRSVGGFTTKIHTVTDALGNHVRFILSAGSVHDIIPSQDLSTGIKNAQILADKTYFSEDNIKFLTKNGNTTIILAKENYTKDHIID